MSRDNLISNGMYIKIYKTGMSQEINKTKYS